MGFQVDDWWGNPSIVSNIFNQGIIASAVFAFKLQDEGELNIGGLNPSLYSGTPYYTPITQPGEWQVTFSTFTVGSTALAGDKAYMSSVRPELHCYSSC